MPDDSVMARVRNKGLLFDGAMGTMLINAGLTGGIPAETWILEKPDEIIRVHRGYARAGADVITTATFGGNHVKLEKSDLAGQVDRINGKAAALARQAAGKNRFVAGNMGPTGELLSPSGTLSFENAKSCFTSQARVLADNGVDLFLLQTFFDINELLAALEGVQSVSKLPVFACMTFRETPRGFASVMGNTVQESMIELQEAGVSVVGANCSLGSESMKSLAGEIRCAVSIPAMAKPNAGMPEVVNGITRYTEDAHVFAANMGAISSMGVEVVGGCCGSTPEYIRQMKRA